MRQHIGYIGQAGTGKTTALIRNLDEYLDQIEWHDHQALLAITFMHGSRKRLNQKLLHISRKGKKVECQTIDSFSIFILNRYRRYMGINKLIIISPDETSAPFISERADSVIVNLSYARTKTCELLQLKVVQSCLQNTYPIIVVDEFQDCEAQLLAIIQSLAKTNILLVAADHFQNLNSETEDCQATTWLKENASIVQLDQIHRTTNTKILETAFALRNNTKVKAGSSIAIDVVPTFNLAAFKISAKIQWGNWGRNGSSIAVISPVNTATSDFVSGCLERLKKPFSKKKPKPYTLYPIFLKEDSKSEEPIEKVQELIPALGEKETVSIEDLAAWDSISNPIVKSAIRATRKLCQLRGLLFVEKYQFTELLSKHHHLHRTFRQVSKVENFIFATIHGAKNREFDYVIILWPYQSPGKPLAKRKLLYNAITRAKKDALLIVQNRSNNINDLKKDPVFSLLVQ